MDSMQSGIDILRPGTGVRGRKGISGSTIKIIAVIAMLIDHIAAVVLIRQFMAEGYMAAVGGGEGQFLVWIGENSLLYYGNLVMRMIGRLGFPLFCFLLVEGAQRSRNLRKYAIRLIIFALVSEIPFDLATTGKVWNSGYQNVYFTLLFGLLTICTYQFFAACEQREEKNDLPGGLRMLFIVTGAAALEVLAMTLVQLFFGALGEGALQTLFFLVFLASGPLGLVLYGKRKGMRRLQTLCADLTVLALFMLAAEFLRTDYGGMGVLTVSVMYLYRRNRVKSMLAGCVVLTLMSASELPAFLAILPVALYNGTRGLKMKYFFYVFYPLHLGLLYLLAVLLGLGGIILIY